jgi:type I restriction enzyme S subunit
MGKWESVRLGQMPIIGGSTPNTNEIKYWNGNYIWITPTDLSKMDTQYIDNSERKVSGYGLQKTTGNLIPANSVIISCRAPVGYCAVVTVPFTFNQGCKAIICNDINSLYLFYQISHSKQLLERVSSGTTFLELPKKELERFEILLPDLPEQERIANVLAAADDAITTSRALLEKYIAIKQGLMLDLLHNGEKVKLGNCMKIYHGKDKKDVENKKGKYPILGSGGLIGYSVQYLWDKPSVLIGRKGTIDAPQYIDTPFWTIDTLFYTELLNGNNAKYFYYIFQTIPWKNYNEATGVPSLNSITISNIFVNIQRDLKEQNRIVEILTAADERIAAERQHLAKLENIKLGLMNDLLTNRVSTDILVKGRDNV